MRTITTLTTCNRNFTIVYHHEHYCSIEDKYITDGKLNKRLTGIELHACKNFQDCVDLTIACCTIEKWCEEGMTKEEAFNKYFGMEV